MSNMLVPADADSMANAVSRMLSGELPIDVPHNGNLIAGANSVNLLGRALLEHALYQLEPDDLKFVAFQAIESHITKGRRARLKKLAGQYLGVDIDNKEHLKTVAVHAGISAGSKDPEPFGLPPIVFAKPSPVKKVKKRSGEKSVADDMLTGNSAIAKFIGCSTGTLFSTHFKNGLPRFTFGGRTCALKSDVMAWVHNFAKQQQAA